MPRLWEREGVLPPIRRWTFAALGVLACAVETLGDAWIHTTIELGVLPAPRLLFAASLLLAGVGWATRPKPGLWGAVAALSLALLTSDTLFRLDVLPLIQPELQGLAGRLLRNTRLHVRPGLFSLAGALVAVLVATAAGMPREEPTLGPGRPAELASFAEGDSWSRVLLRMSLVVLVLDVAFLVVRGSTWDPQGPAILVPISVGALLTALAEEGLFRGLVRPLAEGAVGPRAGNLLQAVLFALVHVAPAAALAFSPELLLREGARLALWTILGWFLGLAARETRGLLVPVTFHTVVGVALHITLVFRPAHFVG